MGNDKSTEREELQKAIEQLKDIQKGNTSSEVIDAIIDKIQEDEDIEDQGNDKAARPSNSNDERQTNL